MTQLRLVQTKSAIGVKPKQRETLRTLGLKHRGDTAVQRDRPEIRGMVAKVSHLLAVEEAG